MKKILLKAILLFVTIIFIGSCQKNLDGTITIVPISPTVLNATTSSSTKINLSWTDNSTNETGFKIERKTATTAYTSIGTTAENIIIFIDKGLIPNNTYTYRVYAYNAAGNSTTYTNEASATTKSITVLTTAAIDSVTINTALSGGNIANDGGSTVTARGIVWSTSPSPTVTLATKTIDGNGIGIFKSKIIGLASSTIYYVRAYATNTEGTGYGNEVSFNSNGLVVPTLTTTAISAITINTSISGGSITNDGGGAITAKGIVWSSSTNPTIALFTKTIDGTGIGTFISNLTGLTANTTYYVRAYATNSTGTGYGNEVIFNTNGLVIPTLTTTAISAITINTAAAGGNITNDGGATITSRGVVWSTNSNPTITLSTKTIDGTGIGSFVSNITGLAGNITYYVRAYATNSTGTAYGNEISFKTNVPLIPTLTTTAINAITSSTSTAGGNITNDGGATVTSRGVVWSINSNPTIALSTKTIDGTGIGTFISNITGLTSNTTYYVKAYATNSAGTAYSNEVSFVTALPVSLQSVAICTQTWMTKNLDVATYRNGDPIPQVTNPAIWATLTTGAYCYYNNDSATYAATYGKLYNWYAVNDPRGLAPSGWHIPSNAEWNTLSACLGGDAIAGGKMKEAGTSHWPAPNTGATNRSGWTGLPGGYCDSADYVGHSPFYRIADQGFWWSSSDYNPVDALGRNLDASIVLNGVGLSSKRFGYSVRCIKD